MEHRTYAVVVSIMAAVIAFVAAAPGFAADKYLIAIVAGSGSRGYSGDGGPATKARINTYDGGTLALDEAGNIYIGDQGNARIRKIDPSGIITTVAGNGTEGFSGDGGPATAAQLFWPYSVAVDATGRIYICDVGNDRFRKIDAAGVISSFEVSSLPGGHGNYGGHGPIETAAFRAIIVEADKEGNLFCATPSVIVKVGPSGAETTIGWSGLNVNTVGSLCTDKAGNLYVLDTNANQVFRVDATGKRTTVAGNGDRRYSGDDGPALKASFLNPNAIAVDGAGNIYIADTPKPDVAADVIRKVDAKTGIITKIAGGGYFTLSAVGGPATGAILGIIGDIAVDEAGNVFLLDDNLGMVWKLYR